LQKRYSAVAAMRLVATSVLRKLRANAGIVLINKRMLDLLGRVQGARTARLSRDGDAQFGPYGRFLKFCLQNKWIYSVARVAEWRRGCKGAVRLVKPGEAVFLDRLESAITVMEGAI